MSSALKGACAVQPTPALMTQTIGLHVQEALKAKCVPCAASIRVGKCTAPITRSEARRLCFTKRQKREEMCLMEAWDGVGGGGTSVGPREASLPPTHQVPAT